MKFVPEKPIAENKWGDKWESQKQRKSLEADLGIYSQHIDQGYIDAAGDEYTRDSSNPADEAVIKKSRIDGMGGLYQQLNVISNNPQRDSTNAFDDEGDNRNPSPIDISEPSHDYDMITHTAAATLRGFTRYTNVKPNSEVSTGAHSTVFYDTVEREANEYDEHETVEGLLYRGNFLDRL